MSRRRRTNWPWRVELHFSAVDGSCAWIEGRRVPFECGMAVLDQLARRATPLAKRRPIPMGPAS